MLVLKAGGSAAAEPVSLPVMMYSPTQLPSSRFPPGQAVGKKLEVRTAGPPGSPF